MSIKNVHCPQRSPRASRALLFMLAGSLIQASCAGNRDNDQPGPNTPPTSERINGIRVPMAPDANLNDATLAGVDANANGVRDDVERILAQRAESKVLFNLAMIIAKQAQGIMLSSPRPPANALKVAYGVIACAGNSMIDSNSRLREEDVMKMIANTPERRHALAAGMSALPSYLSSDLPGCK